MNSAIRFGALAMLTQGLLALVMESGIVGGVREGLAVGSRRQSHSRDQVDEKYCGSVAATANAYPYQVSIQKFLEDGSWNHICGGSIVATDKVITAARCVYYFGSHEIRVVAGEEDLAQDDGTEQVRMVKYAKIHPNYTKDTLAYDYGVIYLTQPFSLNLAVNTIPLSVVEPTYGNCTYTGWRIFYTDNLIVPREFQHANASIITREVCSKYYDQAITKENICGTVVKKWSCHNCKGDLGSPLMCNGSLAAIASLWKDSNCNYPMVFASVAAARDWLQLA